MRADRLRRISDRGARGERHEENETPPQHGSGVTVTRMSRQGDVASALATLLGAPSSAAENVEIVTVRSRAEITPPVVLVRGAIKMVLGDLVIDVARAPCLVLASPWKHVALRGCLVVALPEDVGATAIANARAASAASLAARIEARAQPTIEARLGHLLADLAKRHGTRLSGGTFLALPLRGRDVASLVGTTNESVSRIFAAWKRAGRIRATRDGIWIRT